MPIVVAVAGIGSNVGKTTLVCRLLERSLGWEAIKVTKGHYRSCGRDPHACCVSDLLGDAPLVLTGRDATYARGKDTGRYWDAGAANVHWVVATRKDVAAGVCTALARVSPSAPGVVVEGTGFLRDVAADCAVLVVPSEPSDLKASAASVLPKIDYLYLSGPRESEGTALAGLVRLLDARGIRAPLPPFLADEEIPTLLASLATAAS